MENPALTDGNRGTNRNQLAFLQRVVEKRSPHLLSRLSELEQRPLSVDEREMFRELVADEFMEAGLQENDEPTGYGLALESVIDWLGHV
jgi:hypothetical protein